MLGDLEKGGCTSDAAVAGRGAALTPVDWQRSRILQVAFPCSQPSSEFKFCVGSGFTESDRSMGYMGACACSKCHLPGGHERRKPELGDWQNLRFQHSCCWCHLQRWFPLRGASQRMWKALRDQEGTVAARVGGGPLTLMLMASRP